MPRHPPLHRFPTMGDMSLSLAEELVLLAYDDTGAPRAGTQRLQYGLAGALLMELMLVERVTVVDKRLVVTDPTPTGDPITDEALARLNAGRRARKPKDWLGTLGKGLRERVLDRLVTAGVLRREYRKVLWVFPTTRYPSASGAEPLPEAEVRRRLAAVVDTTGPVDPRTAALCALVRATQIEKLAVPHRPAREVRERFKAVVDESWPADAVRKAIAEMETAVMVAVTATVVTGGQTG